MRRADDQVGSRDVIVMRITLLNLRDAEIKHLGPFAAGRFGQHDVVTLQVAMHDTLFVRGIQSSRDLTHDLDDALELHWPLAPDDFFQRPAVEVFHYQKDNAVLRFAKVGNTHCVRMRNPRRRLRFPGKASDHIVIHGQRWTQNLDGDSLVHQDVLAEVNRAHASALDQFFD